VGTTTLSAAALSTTTLSIIKLSTVTFSMTIKSQKLNILSVAFYPIMLSVVILSVVGPKK
jgi:hypothetical protein